MGGWFDSVCDLELCWLVSEWLINQRAAAALQQNNYSCFEMRLKSLLVARYSFIFVCCLLSIPFCSLLFACYSLLATLDSLVATLCLLLFSVILRFVLLVILLVANNCFLLLLSFHLTFHCNYAPWCSDKFQCGVIVLRRHQLQSHDGSDDDDNDDDNDDDDDDDNNNFFFILYALFINLFRSKSLVLLEYFIVLIFFKLLNITLFLFIFTLIFFAMYS